MCSKSKARRDWVESSSRFSSLFEHDLFGKPLHTFPDHALERMMADRLAAVAVGVTQERADLGLPPRLEAPVAAVGFFRLRPLADGEIDAVRIGGARPFAVAQPIVSAADLDDAERLHD